MNKTSPVLLLILDGWGCDTPHKYNAISQANTPQWDKWQTKGQVTQLHASGHFVGLPNNQMGNSEVGHMHIGAGRIIKQNLTQITDDIASHQFFTNKILCQQIQQAKKHKSNIHLIGLVSDGGVHSHQSHLDALIDVLTQQGVEKAFVHAFLDGRDCPPQDAKGSIANLINKLTSTPYKLASLCGRYFAMDRDKNWDRIKQAYDLLTQQQPINSSAALEVIEQSYQKQIFDEFIQPTPLKDHQPIQKDDLIIFFNFRADRARQLSQALTQTTFKEFLREPFIPVSLLTMTQYNPQLTAKCIYPPTPLENTLGQCVSTANLSQLRIAETEKYAHVTFFFNGGIEAPLPQEYRELIPSPDVKTYDLQPEMSCDELTKKLIDAMHSNQYQLIVCNYANADMVGHTGKLSAATKAIEALDACFIKLNEAINKSRFQVIITADHGNAEKMYDEDTQLAHTAHTSHPVPFIYLGPHKIKAVKEKGSLIDLAPTILQLLSIECPPQITGSSLLTTAEAM